MASTPFNPPYQLPPGLMTPEIQRAWQNMSPSEMEMFQAAQSLANIPQPQADYSSILQQLQAQAPPSPIPGPQVGSPIANFFAQLAGNLGTELGDNPFYQRQVAGLIEQRRQEQQQVEQANQQQAEEYKRGISKEGLAVRMRELEANLDLAMKDGDVKRSTSINTLLKILESRMDARTRAEEQQRGFGYEKELIGARTAGEKSILKARQDLEKDPQNVGLPKEGILELGSYMDIAQRGLGEMLQQKTVDENGLEVPKYSLQEALDVVNQAINVKRTQLRQLYGIESPPTAAPVKQGGSLFNADAMARIRARAGVK